MKLSIIACVVPLSALSYGLIAGRSPSTDIHTERDLPALTRNILTRDSKAESVGLFKRDKSCDIVHVVTWVGCWWLPSKTAPGTDLVKKIDGDTNNIPFECYVRCKSTAIEGISAWYFTRKYSNSGHGGCYVPGYYTDDNCRSTGSGHLPECGWHAKDEKDSDCN
ncbi:hypothetical protein ONS95_010814 [Cadophora gregata]|uniref:uncharacterized protein n=1 Tax=Cadophora gregata TaxID=51156 RepID=UPI0026DB3AD2|nr:uncharacterized protein ONS95_010814 [Cadophora gregata]KAK0119362.1 hypothetical protein ONS95_010814 [Cadophora gregata]KAK0120395.1 hypothetical protein ONS96_010611 [Cadophora gregata f. sp. sojae]